MFQLKETNVSAIVIPSLHLRKHMKTLRKCVFSMFPSTYSGLLNVWWNLRKHKKPSGNWCLFYVSATYPSLVSSHKRGFFSKLSSTCGNYYCSSKHFYFLLRPETAPLLCAWQVLRLLNSFTEYLLWFLPLQSKKYYSCISHLRCLFFFHK